MNKLNLGVLFGGQSSEHDVSCISASYVVENLDPEKYNVYTFGITREGKWFYFTGSTQEMRDGTWEQNEENAAAYICPDAMLHGATIFRQDGTHYHISLDVVFPVLHGKYGEDGTVQGLMELSNIRYVGPHVLASAVAMDKVAAKLLCQAQGIDQCKWMWFSAYDLHSNHSAAIEKIESNFSYPVYVKPANAGSSIGITKAHDTGTLVLALHEALKHDDKVLIEEAVVGREIECGVLGNDNPIASLCGEVLPSVDFYDFDAKYNSDTPNTQVPAELDEETMNRIRETAIRCYKALFCQGLSRVDFFLKEDGTLLLNEINTIPGFTSISMYAQMFAASGIPYSELLDKLIAYALEA
jgi:D-alanine-D-alanine ligase